MWRLSTDKSGVKAGIHGVIGFTHAMFVLGAGDWQSLAGGQFQALDDHLAYLKTRYGAAGVLQFATATQLVREYLDYYSPEPVVVYDAKISDSFGVTEYGLTILGRDIPIAGNRQHGVSVKYPLYLRPSACHIVVSKNGQPIYSTWEATHASQ